ncbi:MAG: bifunctional oligoribonuclease/PAP phosphatase NrnA [Dethiobacter sp.]|jgi:phosphoesterase RecJ-like protein|nr:MAG: bifunctional oligoribonuclease/PAP phosphatase NrnA [Dethiobacter sp.]
MIDFNILALLDKYDNITILTHIRPDGDAIGSSLALGIALQQRGKKAKMLCSDKIPSKYSFLPGIEEFQDLFPEEEEGSLAFILDCSDLDRLGWMKEKVLKFEKIINIDHHITNDKFGDVNWVDSSAASTGELVFQLLQENNLEINYEISLNLYVAISSDTGSFKYENTTPQTMRIAGALLEKGINPSIVSQKLFDEYPLSTILLLRDSLATLEFDPSGKIAWMNVQEEMLRKYDAKPAELDGFVNYLKNIEEVEVGVLFYHTDNEETKVGFRSKNIDVASIAQTFGGGGHPRASGCTVSDKPQEVVKRVLEVINNCLNENSALINTK